MALGKRDVGEFIIKRAGKLGLEPVADREARTGTVGGGDDDERMRRAGDDRVAAVEPETEAAGFTLALAGHFERAQGGRFDLNGQFLGRGDEDVAAVWLAPEDGREQAHHRLAPDRIALMIPGAIAGDAHVRIAAVGGMPLVDRGTRARLDRGGERIEPLSGEVDRGAGLGHDEGFRAPVIASASDAIQCLRALDCFVTAFLAMTIEKTALVTGAGKRVGRAIAEALRDDGWRVATHVHRDGDAVPEGTIKVVADLTAAGFATAMFDAVGGPVGLLVNSAARFERDGFGAISADEFQLHMSVNALAPMLLTDELARRHSGGEALVVNISDAKLAAPNPDYLSYTLSKAALAGLTEVSARALAGQGIRVNAIAPSVMLTSGPQDEADFAKVHAFNPLGVGTEVADVVAAVRFLIGQFAMTGVTLQIDGGQRFMQLARDVQFLETK